MKESNKDKIKVQVIIKGKAAWLYKNIDKGLRSKAIEKGLMLLADDKVLKEIFFDDIEMVDAIKSIEEKPNLSEKEQNSQSKAPKKQSGPVLEDMIKWPFGPIRKA